MAQIPVNVKQVVLVHLPQRPDEDLAPFAGGAADRNLSNLVRQPDHLVGLGVLLRHIHTTTMFMVRFVGEGLALSEVSHMWYAPIELFFFGVCESVRQSHFRILLYNTGES